ncbi:hypothetical protein CONCODRAFT_2749 [Conidiobolus coronatus NRRL 28638]|uniref:Uncharacterized protein n=1 Tax=Conidiobolus coronatus (strain ATCC 28846 / CBS 209.66 / NRRL 28638) TaxID=796925 RepID=A0A137PGT9_CONC2|nr:hypothetical protein CONCODRAFT_2749 [Conidiobolus coronatus NRRL 28638]|eukprot:KXN74216.1 hypothetical protein CONCODRAFT_2749 [Conidiobolus coronatus NRRL 28638]
MKIFGVNETLIEVGDLVYCKNFDITLKIIIEDGDKGFYEGEVTKDIFNTVQSNVVREHSSGKFLNSTIYSTSVLSFGSILVNGLELLDPVIRSNVTGTQKGLYYRFLKCLKFGYVARTSLTDSVLLNFSNK